MQLREGMACIPEIFDFPIIFPFIPAKSKVFVGTCYLAETSNMAKSDALIFIYNPGSPRREISRKNVKYDSFLKEVKIESKNIE